MSSGAHACAKLTAASITPTTVENPQTLTCLILGVGAFLMCISQFCFVEKS